MHLPPTAQAEARAFAVTRAPLTRASLEVVGTHFSSRYSRRRVQSPPTPMARLRSTCPSSARQACCCRRSVLGTFATHGEASHNACCTTGMADLPPGPVLQRRRSALHSAVIVGKECARPMCPPALTLSMTGRPSAAAEFRSTYVERQARGGEEKSVAWDFRRDEACVEDVGCFNALPLA